MTASKRFSASEIAAMGLPGLPRSKARVIERANLEAWPYEEVKAIGGTRRLYEVPSKYLESAAETLEPPASAPKGRVVGRVAGSTGRVDIRLLDAAIEALGAFEEKFGVEVPEARRSAWIAVLYDILVEDGALTDDRLETLFKALG